jgi:hypothetical protein
MDITTLGLIREHYEGKNVLPILADYLEERGDERSEAARMGTMSAFVAEVAEVVKIEREESKVAEWCRLTEVKAGKYVEPDSWAIGSSLVKDETGMATFRLQSARYADIAYPVNVTVTGRTYQYKHGSKRVRVKVEFVHDAEESTVHGGWMVV